MADGDDGSGAAASAPAATTTIPAPASTEPSASASASASASTAAAAAATASALSASLGSHLESVRCYQTELEASLLLIGELLRLRSTDASSGSSAKHEGDGATAVAGKEGGNEGKRMPGGVADALRLVRAACRRLEPREEALADAATDLDAMEWEGMAAEGDEMGTAGLPTTGRLGQAATDAALMAAVDRAVRLAEKIEQSQQQQQQQQEGQKEDGPVLAARLVQLVEQVEAEAKDKAAAAEADINNEEEKKAEAYVEGKAASSLLLESFYGRLSEVREYHAKHSHEQEQQQQMQLQRQRGALTSIDSSLNPLEALTRGNKRRRLGNPEADGYDLRSVVRPDLLQVRGGQRFSPNEVLGLYLDLTELHDGLLSGGGGGKSTFAMELAKTAAANSSANNSGTTDKDVKDQTSSTAATGTANDADAAGGTPAFPYVDFVSLMTQPLSDVLPESTKLQHRKKYVRFLTGLGEYLDSFLMRTVPFLNVEKDVVRPALQEFEQVWSETGGFVPGWKALETERVLADAANIAGKGDEAKSSDAPTPKAAVGIDLAQFSSPEELCNGVGADALKAELSRIGLKCGGAPLDRAKRLFLTKDTDLADLPKKLWAKGRGPPPPTDAAETVKSSGEKEENGKGDQSETPSSKASLSFSGFAGSMRRVDVARLEVATQSLLDQLRPIVEATVRRAERQLYQTPNEREVELDEEINGGASEIQDKLKRKKEDGEEGDSSDIDSDEEEDAPIYNPKGVPLGWDGKPIPYWLFKLHGLNHFYSCEICGNESYRGRHNFEKHFQESKHMYGMRCLGIPNTRHFHGVTKIADAQALWEKLQQNVEGAVFDGENEEEYEDSHGNVLKRKTYEDLARQGLI